MTSYLSIKIRVISFVMMILVVILHANIIHMSVGASRLVQMVFTDEYTRIAVPLFFLISGYLLFLNCDGSWEFFRQKMLRRIKTLVVPYLILTIIGGIIWAISKGTGIIETVINSVLLSPKLFYQLWFLHDLILMVYLSPLFFYIFKKTPYLWAFICYFWITVHYWEILNFESFFFWGVGGIIALQAPAMAEQNWGESNPIIVGLFVVWICTSTFIIYTEERSFWIHGSNILLGIFVAWGIYDITPPSVIRFLTQSNYLSYSFFLYLFHEPILTGYKKSMLTILELNQFTSMIIYIVSPILTLCTILLVGQFAKRHTPIIYHVITGNR